MLLSVFIIVAHNVTVQWWLSALEMSCLLFYTLSTLNKPPNIIYVRRSVVGESDVILNWYQRYIKKRKKKGHGIILNIRSLAASSIARFLSATWCRQNTDVNIFVGCSMHTQMCDYKCVYGSGALFFGASGK